MSAWDDRERATLIALLQERPQGASWPAQLREIHQVPPVLFSRGTLRPGESAVSVVGSRRACDQSLDWASEVSAALVSAGITRLRPSHDRRRGRPDQRRPESGSGGR